MKALTKPQKILAVMFELGNGKPAVLSYEDIVVRAFKRYPQDFQLRGYPQYPDSSDIHKPLYAMKKKGWVRSANKRFELTSSGFEIASTLVHHSTRTLNQRLTKQEEREIGRILASEGFELFQKKRENEIIDTDFYEYLGVSVRTSRNDFLGRLHTVENAIHSYDNKSPSAKSKALINYHLFMMEKFEEEIIGRK